MKNFSATFCLLLVLSSCQNDKPEDKHLTIANAFCDCTAKLVELNNKAVDMQADTNAVLDLQHIEVEYNNAQNCAASVISHYGRLNAEAQNAVMNHVRTQCPALSQQQALLHELMGR